MLTMLTINIYKYKNRGIRCKRVYTYMPNTPNYIYSGKSAKEVNKVYKAKVESEKNIEAHLRDKVKGIGGRAYKWESPGNNGVPDRIIFLPGGKTYLVELKAPGKKPTALQKNQHLFLTQLGQKVYVLDSKAKVDSFIAEVSSE